VEDIGLILGLGLRDVVHRLGDLKEAEMRSRPKPKFANHDAYVDRIHLESNKSVSFMMTYQFNMSMLGRPALAAQREHRDFNVPLNYAGRRQCNFILLAIVHSQLQRLRPQPAPGTCECPLAAGPPPYTAVVALEEGTSLVVRARNQKDPYLMHLAAGDVLMLRGDTFYQRNGDDKRSLQLFISIPTNVFPRGEIWQ
jgi:hypothetical protein